MNLGLLLQGLPSEPQFSSVCGRLVRTTQVVATTESADCAGPGRI